jgi:hypothetical protein
MDGLSRGVKKLFTNDPAGLFVDTSPAAKL